MKYGNEIYQGIEEKIVGIITELKMQKQVILKSFDMSILKRFEVLIPDVKRLYCTFYAGSWFTVDDFFRFDNVFERGKFQYLQIHKYFITQDIINEAHAKRIKVVAWDVHDQKTIVKFKKNKSRFY